MLEAISRFTASTVLVSAVGDTKSFVLISDQQKNSRWNTRQALLQKLTLILCVFFNRINKKGSQKDAEQKKNGNYFFYDDGAGDEDSDIDDDDL